MDSKLIQALSSLSVETGSLVCLGCSYENACSIHGCAIMRIAADRLEQLTAEPPNDPLMLEELRGMDGEIEKLRMQVRVKDACISGKSSIVNHMETERDAARPSAEVLEAIDELVEFARDRMSIGVWLGYVNVLNEWRGAQGEG